MSRFFNLKSFVLLMIMFLFGYSLLNINVPSVEAAGKYHYEYDFKSQIYGNTEMGYRPGWIGHQCPFSTPCEGDATMRCLEWNGWMWTNEYVQYVVDNGELIDYGVPPSGEPMSVFTITLTCDSDKLFDGHGITMADAVGDGLEVKTEPAPVVPECEGPIEDNTQLEATGAFYVTLMGERLIAIEYGSDETSVHHLWFFRFNGETGQVWCDHRGSFEFNKLEGERNLEITYDTDSDGENDTTRVGIFTFDRTTGVFIGTFWDLAPEDVKVHN